MLSRSIDPDERGSGIRSRREAEGKGLQATVSNLSVASLNDARVRAQYARDIRAVARDLEQAVATGRLSVTQAAEQANALRNKMLDITRRRTSPTARAYATRTKGTGPTLGQLAEKYAQRNVGKPFSGLNESQQTAVMKEIMRSSGRPSEFEMAHGRMLGRVGRRLLLVSIGVAVYEVVQAEDKPREVARQGVLAGTGAAGGWAVGAAVVATGACVATAPVCVGAAELIGGLVAAYGAEMTFDSLLPRP